MRNLLELFEELSDVLHGVGINPQNLLDGTHDARQRAAAIRVCAAYQPSYPLAGSLGNLVLLDKEGEREVDAEESENVCWITIHGHPWDMNPYAPAACFEEW